jgi:hypothetical protein
MVLLVGRQKAKDLSMPGKISICRNPINGGAFDAQPEAIWRSGQKCTEGTYDLLCRRKSEHHAAVSCISLSKDRHEGACLFRL